MRWVESGEGETWKEVPGKGTSWANPRDVEHLTGSGSQEERTQLRQGVCVEWEWDIWSQQNHPGPSTPDKGIQIWPVEIRSR